MPRSPSPDRHSERSRHSSSRHHARTDDRDAPTDRRRSRSPRRRDERRSESRREDRGKERERSRSRSRSRSRERRSSRRDRSRSRSREREHRSSHRRRSRSRSRSVDSGSDSDDSRGGKRHRRRRSRSRDRDDKERRRRREEKKERRAKREEKKRAKKGLKTVNWGAHGILTEADRYTKSDEFAAWLIGEKMLNPETLSKQKEKEIFLQFMEDFNTCTLPHEKYYDINKYEKQMAAVRMGETVAKDDGYDFMKDMDAARASYRRSATAASNSAADHLMDHGRLQELRRIQADRVQKEKMQRLGMSVSENLGVRLEDKMRD